MDWLADEPPMFSVPECRQTPGGLPHQKCKAQGVLRHLVIPLCPCRQQIWLRGFSPSTASQARRAGRQKPPRCSVPECRQTPGGLHHQKSKAQGVTVPRDPFVSLQTVSLAAGLLSFYSFLGRTQAPSLPRRAGRQKPPRCSVPECRQNPGGLHHQKSKTQGVTVPSDPFVSLQTANMAAGLLSFHSFPRPAGWQTKAAQVPSS